MGRQFSLGYRLPIDLLFNGLPRQPDRDIRGNTHHDDHGNADDDDDLTLKAGWARTHAPVSKRVFRLTTEGEKSNTEPCSVRLSVTGKRFARDTMRMRPT